MLLSHPGERGHFALRRHLIHGVGAGLAAASAAHLGTGAAAAQVIRWLLVVGPLLVEHLLAAAGGGARAGRHQRFGRVGNPLVDIAAVHTLGGPGERFPRKNKIINIF